MEAFTELVQSLAISNPRVSSLLLVIGSFRLLAKPLMLALHQIAERSDWQSLERFLEFVEQSKIMKAVFFLLDYVGSIKIPESRKKKEKRL